MLPTVTAGNTTRIRFSVRSLFDLTRRARAAIVRQNDFRRGKMAFSLFLFTARIDRSFVCFGEKASYARWKTRTGRIAHVVLSVPHRHSVENKLLAFSEAAF